MYGEGLGEMAWMDLSVDDAETVSRFYQKVLGWNRESISMTVENKKYNDFVMTSSKESTGLEPSSSSIDVCSNDSSVVEAPTSSVNPQSLMTGICHARGENLDMPAVWLPYFLVGNLDEAVISISENGGSLATKIKNIGADRYVVFKDPAGAMAAIYQKAS